MRHTQRVLAGLLVVIAGVYLVLVLGGCGGGDEAMPPAPGEVPTPPTPIASAAPIFSGIQCIATAGGPYVRIGWRGAVDDETPVASIVYRVFAGATPASIDWTNAIAETTAGATSILLSNSDSALIAIGARVWLGVRAFDTEGNVDPNEVAVSVIPVAPSSVAYVDQGAPSPDGVVGDSTAPFQFIQDAVAALDDISGGVILVSAEPAGTRYEERIDITEPSTLNIGLYGGFPRFDALAPGATGAEILLTRNITAFQTMIAPNGPADQVVRVVNQRTPTFFDGFWFVDGFPTDPTIRAAGVDLQVTCCDVTVNGFQVEAYTNGEALASDSVFVGNAFHAPEEFHINLEGAMNSVRVENNVFDRSPDGADCVTGDLWVPPTGLLLLANHNVAENTDSFVDVGFSPADKDTGGVLTIYIEDNECRGLLGRAVALWDLAQVGPNGSVQTWIRYNLFNGTNDETIRVQEWEDTGGGSPFTGVETTLVISDNAVLNTDDHAYRLNVGVSALETSTVTVAGNWFSSVAGQPLRLHSIQPDTVDANLSDQGTMIANLHGNVISDGTEDFNVEYGVTHGGFTQITVQENTVLGSSEQGLNLDLNSHIGFSDTMWPSPDGFVCLNIFNNHFASAGSEAFEFDDRRNEDDGDFTQTRSLAAVYVGNNVFGPTTDGDETVGIQHRLMGSHGLVFMQRNVIGFGGDDDADGLRFEVPPSAIPYGLRYENNAITACGGSGIALDIEGGRPFFVNNTMAWNSSSNSSRANIAVRDDHHWPNAVFLNCIGAFGGVADVEADSFIAFDYSLIRDGTSETGPAPATGDPFFAKNIRDLPAWPFEVASLGDLFRLAPLSPCVDAGDPESFFDDPDGTRNDMGAHGGPGAGSLGILPAGTPLPFVFVGEYPLATLESGAQLVDHDSALTFVFNRRVDLTTAAGAITVRNAGNPVSGAFASAFDGKGVTFTPDATLVLDPQDRRVEVAISTSLLSESGESLRSRARVRLAVRSASVEAEAEPNNDPASATPITGPSFLFGGVIFDNSDVDIYRFDATAGQEMAFSLFRIREGMSGALRLMIVDENGPIAQSAYGDDDREGTFGSADPDNHDDASDPFVRATALTTGTHYLVVMQGSGATPAPTPALYSVQGVIWE